MNLPVQDLARSARFYQAIGCVKNEQFSDRNAASMVWSEAIAFQLLARDYYAAFTNKPIVDAHANNAILMALTQDMREQVDRIVQAAGESGGKTDLREPQDLGFMYLRTFEDPDGHTFEPVWMEPDAAIAGAERR
jgi:predicted lactoylglutathione lyase